MNELPADFIKAREKHFAENADNVPARLAYTAGWCDALNSKVVMGMVEGLTSAEKIIGETSHALKQWKEQGEQK